MRISQQQFLSAAEVNNLFKYVGRHTGVQMMLCAHLQLPSGSAKFVASYIRALIAETHGPINGRLIRRFNKSSRARQLMADAEAVFTTRLKELTAAAPQPRLLIIDDAAELLGVARSAVEHWCHAGILPLNTEHSPMTIKPHDLASRCKWVIPT